MRPSSPLRQALPSALLLALFAACTPYAVHTTALPLAPGEGTVTSIMTVVPNGLQFDSTGAGVAVPSLDVDIRRGYDERTDIGIRINSASGVITTMRRRLDGPTSRPGPATAVLLGAGFVNLGQHAHLEASLLHSGDPDRGAVPYGGLRVIQVLPMTSTAVHDNPAVGAFGGIRLGDGRAGLGLEVGVFYDQSALKMRQRNVLVVPSLSFTGLGRRRPRYIDRRINNRSPSSWPDRKPSAPTRSWP